MIDYALAVPLRSPGLTPAPIGLPVVSHDDLHGVITAHAVDPSRKIIVNGSDPLPIAGWNLDLSEPTKDTKGKPTRLDPLPWALDRLRSAGLAPNDLTRRAALLDVGNATTIRDYRRAVAEALRAGEADPENRRQGLEDDTLDTDTDTD